MTHAFTLALDQNYLKLQKAAILHIEGGSKEVALKSAQKFLTNYPQEAEANYNMARALVRLEKQHLALDYAELANKLKPNRAQYVFLLGRLYLNFAMYEYAAPLLREAVLKLPDNLLIQWAMADYQFALNNGPLARLHYEKALLLTPDQEQLPYILCDYAKCLTTIGDKEEARKTYTKLATIKSFEMIALVKLSVLEKYKPDSEIAERLRASLDHKELDILCRSEILLSLGNMHENVGEYNAAFEYWTQSRSLKIISGEHDIGNREYINITQFYSPKLLSAAEQYGHKSERPVFVVGMPRSGTTLTEQIISSHPQAYGVGELGRMHKLEKIFIKDYQSDPENRRLLTNAGLGELRARAEETLNLLNIIAGSEPLRVVDKLPSQYLTMGFIHLCFPEAKYIHCQRHPADSFISSFQNNMNQFHEYSFDQAAYAEAFLTKERLMSHWLSIFPDKIYNLHYEKLVSKPEETVREILEFLGLPWDPACLKFFEKSSTIKTLSKDQVRNPIYTSSVGRWRNYEKHLAPLFSALKEANYIYPEL